jgi:hypothetical protein
VRTFRTQLADGSLKELHIEQIITSILERFAHISSTVELIRIFMLLLLHLKWAGFLESIPIFMGTNYSWKDHELRKAS